jgi:hypothetical protein
LQSLVLAIFVIGGSTLASILGLLLVRKRFDVRTFQDHHEVGGYLLSILGTLYSVVLGFMVVDVSNPVQEQKTNIATEANSMLNVYRLSDGLPAARKLVVEQACIEYCHAVVEDEWDEMVQGRVCVRAWRAMQGIWKSIKEFAPVTPQEQCFYSAILESYDAMCAARRIRLANARGSVSPILWLVLVGGAVSTVGFTFVFGVEKLSSQILMTALVTIMLSLNIYLVIISSSPFGGDFKIRPTTFRMAAKFLELRGKIPTDPEALFR